jgi:hypothetical protein
MGSRRLRPSLESQPINPPRRRGSPVTPHALWCSRVVVSRSP